jgi:SAM-dependent methyltransferase
VRKWVVGSREEVDAVLGELRRLAAEPPGVWTDVPRRSVEEGYGEWAETYDLPGNPILHLEGPFVSALLAESPPGVALDAACGTGRHAAVLVELGHKVIGVDASQAMLSKARARVPSADLRQGDLAGLPVADDAVDLAVCSLALTHLADPVPAIRELARVVKPGGRLEISDVHPTWVALGAQACYRSADERRGFVWNHVHQVSSYLECLSDAGLEVLACHELLYGREEVDLWAGRLEMAYDVVVDALVGMPAALVWHLARA